VRGAPSLRRASLLLAAVLLLLGPTCEREEPAGAFDYDLAFRGATLYLGDERLVPGDLAIRGERIAAVGTAPGRARREIDAAGLVAAPGFIDLHNHSDIVYQKLGWLPLPASVHANANYLTQGVTTIVTGNCGSGPATPEAVRDFLEEMDEAPFGTNVAHLVPHGDLRLAAMGEGQLEREDPRPSPEEMARMREWVAEDMRAGAFGLSTGLEYDPGARAETAELVDLARVAGRYGGLYASHTRHEGPDPQRMLASYAEAIAVGEQAGVRAHISHIKLAGRSVHGMTGPVIALVESAQRRGVRVTADQYPYTAGATTIAMPAPVELRDGPRVHERYCKGPGRETLRAGILETFATQMGPEDIFVAFYPWRFGVEGKTLAEAAAGLGEPPVDLAMDLACGWYGLGIYFTQDEEDVRAFTRQPWVATASDGSTIPDWLGRFAHPRLYGTFPRKLRRYALDEGLISLGFALRSMTDLPAEILGLEDRGRLRAGSFADVVVFDPGKIRDLATFEDPGRHSEGVVYLLVNGGLAIDAGELTGVRTGRALRGPGYLAP
jgi:N-acyl-D-amino-acid deacylase